MSLFLNVHDRTRSEKLVILYLIKIFYFFRVFRSEDVELENARNRSRQSGESMTWDSFYHHHEVTWH